jgi:aspartyl protease family protein
MVFISLSSCERKSGRRNAQRPQNTSGKQTRHTDFDSQSKTIIKMENENGVKYVWIEINGIRLRFIFDTGASNICISAAEATVLYRQGTLQKEDILDVQYFQDATGKVSAGTRINLRTVKIGNRLLENIKAIVIDNNDAPLLLGQSALENFGKISIDNKNGEIIFE